MNGWIYVALVLGALLAVGAWVDWRRRGSTGGKWRSHDAGREFTHFDTSGPMDGPG